MQINFEAEKIKAAHAYVNRLTPIKVEKKVKIKSTSNNKIVLDKSFYTNEKEEKSSFLKDTLNFLFK